MTQEKYNPLERVQSHDWNKERLEQLKKALDKRFY